MAAMTYVGAAVADPALQPQLQPVPAAAFTPPPSARVDEVPFPRPTVLAPAVAFWTRVFSEFSENQIVIHSVDYPQKVFTVLDYTAQAASGMSAESLHRLQLRDQREALDRVDELLRQVDRLQSQPEKMTPEQRRIYDLFADVDDPHKFRHAIGRVRAQLGLMNRTHKALEISGRYMPNMEAIFQSHGLPVQLTRLPLVESSFNVDAYSKVGAAGLWQFIPSSARIYMRLDEVVDDRRDPWFSTEAAAQHLKDDYDALQDWPLAVTAYNYGRLGIARALEEIHGKTLEDLLARYDSRRFGFASRNFYAEFLAALDVERNYKDHFGEVQRDPALDFDVVQTRDYVPYETLRQLSGADEETFRQLNPAYSPAVVEGNLYVPPGHTIRVPAGRADAFTLAYAALGADERFDHQRTYYASYRVERGDTLSAIAHRYRVSARAVQLASGMTHPGLLRIGQMLKIPPRDFAIGGTHAAKATTVAAAERTEQPGFRLHRVRAGQTLSAIARRYRVTVQDILRANGLSDPQLIRAGATLKIPGA